MAVARTLSSQKPGESESCLSVSTLYVRFSTSKKPPQNQNAVPHNLNLFLCHSCKCKGKMVMCPAAARLAASLRRTLVGLHAHGLFVNGEWAMVNIDYSPLPIHKRATNLISRILFLNYHLSGPGITAVILLPTLDVSRLRRDRASRPQSILYVALQHPRFTRVPCYHGRP